jgi:hypothetical protein
MKYPNLTSYAERQIKNFLDLEDSDGIFDSDAKDYEISSPFAQNIASQLFNYPEKIIDIEVLDIDSPTNPPINLSNSTNSI